MNKKFINISKNIKAQMTIFIALGFVILIIFMMLSLVSQSVRKAKIQGEAKQALKSFIETSTIQQYIVSCVDAVLEDGVEKISLQGGSLYDYQYGELSGGINTSEFVIGEDYITINLSALPLVNNSYADQVNRTVNVTYAMKMSNNTGEFPYLNGSSKLPPTYPYSNKKLSFLNGFTYGAFLYIPMLEGFYGETTMPKLCINQRHCGSEDSARFNNFNKTTYEEQLESYLEVKIQECVNFSYFEEMTPNTIERGNITAEVVFSIDKITAMLDYPITLYWRNAEPVTEILSFNKDKNIRFSKVYKLAHTILKYESFDLFFDSLDYRSVYAASNFFSCRMADGSRCYDSQISVTKIPNVCSDCGNGQFDDLIVIRDNSSKINGLPLQFQFLIENRRPALDYISFYPIADIDIIAFENQTLNLTPEGYDPDSTNVWYSYSGWRENYWTWFNKSLWYEDPPEDPMGFDFSDYYTSYSPILDLPYFSYYDEPEPHNWTKSPEYVYTEQNASCYVEYGDLGLHSVNITIWDEEGLKDWQEVKIYVRDLPKAIANGSNNFSDIGNGNASVEDPYILDASLSYSIIGELADEFRYLWSEYDEPISIETGHLTTILPYPVPYNIFNILGYVFNTSRLEGAISRPAVITLDVGLIMGDGSIVYGEPDSMYLNISQCLPHVNADDQYNPYPYNTSAGFQATHACCGNGTEGFLWGERKNDTAVCYNITEHAALKYFLDNHLDDWYAPYPNIYLGGTDLTYSGYPPFLIGDYNDVYTRNFDRYCDGTRGNICNGSGVYNLTVAHDCNSSLLSHQTESCYGPPENYFTSSDIGGNADECVVYNAGTTFEELNLGLSETRPCATEEACYGAINLAGNPLFKDGGFVQYRTADSVGPDPENVILCEQAFCTGGTYPAGGGPLGNCANVKGSNCSCSSDLCNADEACDGEDPGHRVNEILNTWCNISCTVQECGFYNFDDTAYSCFAECDDNGECVGDDVFCDRPTSNPSRECLKCYAAGSHLEDSGLQEAGINGVGDCEMACGADFQCDEKPQGTLPTGAGCNQTCEYIMCPDNFAYDSSNFICFEAPCNNNNQCMLGYECQTATGNCVFDGT